MSRRVRASSAGPAPATPWRASVACLCILGATLLFSLGSAQAATIHSYASSFGSAGSGDGQLTNPQGVAIDQSIGNVYVADAGNHRIEKFDSAGNFLAAWGWGVQNGAAESQVCTSGCQAGIPGSGAGQFESPAYVAVDNSEGPSKGDVYVGDPGRQVVEKFTSSGALISTNDGCTSGRCISESLVFGGIAVDPSGNLFLSQSQETSEYGQDGTYLGHNRGNNGNIAVDSADNIYVFHEGDEIDGVLKFNFFEAFKADYEVTPGGYTLAVDPATDALYVGQPSAIQIFSPTNHPPLSPPLEEFGAGHVDKPAGIAVNAANASAYASDPGADAVQLYSSVTIPDANAAAATDLGTISATLNGTVNPLGIDAHYQFEWGKTTAYGHLAPVAPSDAGSGSEPVEVSEGIVGLEPGTTYHYRLIATNENGTFHGPDETFTTLLPVVIREVFVSSVGSAGATVNAMIDPGGGPATFHVEYGTSEAYGQSIPATDASAGSGSSNNPVTQTIQGLEPDTTYHYRFVAGNGGGTVAGEDHTFHTFGAPQAGLPDGRAYEMVSPPDKNGGNIATQPELTRVAASGDAVSFPSEAAFADAQGTSGMGDEYISQRGPEGWATHGITPTQIPEQFPLASASYVGDFTPDLSTGIFLASSTLEPGHPNVQDSWNLYGASNLLAPHAASFQLLSDSVNPVSAVSKEPRIFLAATSTDLSYVLFTDSDNLTVDASATSSADPKVYQSVDGTLHLEGYVPPPGQASCGPSGPACEVASASIPGASLAAKIEGPYTNHAISTDGSRVFFEAAPFEASETVGVDAGPGEFGTLYMREAGVTTTQLNVSERSTPDPSGPQSAKFLDASADGSKAFFVTKQELTDEDTNTNYDIYMYDLSKPEGERLTLISRDENAIDGEGDAGFVIGTSADGSYVYFTADNQLVPGQPGFAELNLGSTPQNAEFMYVWHEGEVRFVGAKYTHELTGSGTSSVWRNELALAYGLSDISSTDVTPDGKHVVFPSRSTGLAQLAAGYDNTSAHCSESSFSGDQHACQEIYVYSYQSDHLACVSCDPSGQSPLGHADTTRNDDPTLNVSLSAVVSQHLQHSITDDGNRVFFSSPDPLVAGDTNSRYDVYEYDAETGRVSLLSTGECNCDSYFVEASPDGKNVFFTTAQRLVAIDTDNNSDLYDVRVGGGIAAQNRVPAPQCEGDACQSPPAATPEPTLSTSVSSGPGNPAAGSRGRHHRKHHKRKKHKRSSTANAKGGGAR